jgi:hypothetical protein
MSDIISTYKDKISLTEKNGYVDLLKFLIDNIKNPDIIKELTDKYQQLESGHKIKQCDVKFKQRLLNSLNFTQVKCITDIAKSLIDFQENEVISMTTSISKILEFDVKEFKINIDFLLALISAYVGDLVDFIKKMLEALSRFNLLFLKDEDFKSCHLEDIVYYKQDNNRGHIELFSLKFQQKESEKSFPIFTFGKKAIRLSLLYYKGEFDLRKLAKYLKFGDEEVEEIVKNSV